MASSRSRQETDRKSARGTAIARRGMFSRFANGNRRPRPRLAWRFGINVTALALALNACALFESKWLPQGETPADALDVVMSRGRELQADSVRVSVFHQQQTNGQWLEVPTTPTTATDLENKILGRAQRLRGQALGTGEGG